MPIALLVVVYSLALLASGATIASTSFGLPLKMTNTFTNPNGTVDHDSAVLHGIDIFNKYQRILDHTGNRPNGWDIAEYRTLPPSLKRRVDGSGPLKHWRGPIWTAQISIGTPAHETDPQIFTVSIDTGSSDLWVPDVQCTVSCKNKKKYNGDHSSSSKQIRPATYEHEYADGLGVEDGDVFTDIVRVATASVFCFPFGTAGAVRSGRASYPKSPYDGILGLALPQRSQLPPGYKDDTLVPTLFRQGQISRNAFSLRLSSDDAVSEIFLGGENPAKYTGVFDDHVVKVGTGFWQVSGGIFVVGGEQIITGQEFIIDSGANHIYGDFDLVREIYGRIDGSIEYDPENGLHAFPCASLDTLPTIGLSFGPGKEEWRISRDTFNLGPIESDPNMCEGAIAGEDLKALSIDKAWIIGTPFLQNVYTRFVPDETPVIGFATPAP